MLKKKTVSLFVIIFCAFSMTSCIGIIEKILFNKNGSGTYSMTLDMSEAVKMMAAFGDVSAELDTGLDSLNNVFNIRAKALEAINGISNVRQEVNKEQLIFSIILDFKDVHALNQGMSEFYKDESTNQAEQFVFFKESKGSLERTNINRVLDALDYALNSEEMDQEFNPAAFLGEMFYEQQISFNSDIKSFSNSTYVQGDGTNWDEKALRWKKYLFKPADKDKVIDVLIKTN